MPFGLKPMRAEVLRQMEAAMEEQPPNRNKGSDSFAVVMPGCRESKSMVGAVSKMVEDMTAVVRAPAKGRPVPPPRLSAAQAAIERFLVVHAVSVLLVVSGTVVTVLAAPASGKIFTLNDMLDRFDTAAVSYSVAIGVVLISAAVSLERATWGGNAVPVAQRFHLAALAAFIGGASNGFVALGVKVVSSAVAAGEWQEFARAPLWAYALLGNAALVAQVGAGVHGAGGQCADGCSECGVRILTSALLSSLPAGVVPKQ